MNPVYLLRSTQQFKYSVDAGMSGESLRTIRPMFCKISFLDDFGSMNAAELARLVSTPSPMVLHEEIIYGSVAWSKSDNILHRQQNGFPGFPGFPEFPRFPEFPGFLETEFRFVATDAHVPHSTGVFADNPIN